MIQVQGDAKVRWCLGGGEFRRWCLLPDEEGFGRRPIKCEAASPRQATAMMLTWLSPTARGPLDWPVEPKEPELPDPEPRSLVDEVCALIAKVVGVPDERL